MLQILVESFTAGRPDLAPAYNKLILWYIFVTTGIGKMYFIKNYMYRHSFWFYRDSHFFFTSDRRTYISSKIVR